MTGVMPWINTDRLLQVVACCQLKSGFGVKQLKLHFTPFQPVEHVAAVIDGRSVDLEVHLELRQNRAQTTAFLPCQITMKAVERP